MNKQMLISNYFKCTNNNNADDKVNVNVHPLSNNTKIDTYFNQTNQLKEQDIKWKQENNKITDKIDIFTDGSTINNGKKNASGGFGVYFPDKRFHNISTKYNKEDATNQKCELIAILKGLEYLFHFFKDKSKMTNIVVYTDSKYSIDCFTKYIKNWKSNGWKLRNNQQVKNRNLIEKIDYYIQQFNFVRFHHIYSHKDEPYNKNSLEYYLWYGNDMADRLANEGRTKKIFNNINS